MTQPELVSDMERPTAEAPLCPSCSKGTGRLFSVTLKGTVRTLTYQCEDCRQPWPVIDHWPGPNDPPVGSPKQQ